MDTQITTVTIADVVRTICRHFITKAYQLNHRLTAVPIIENLRLSNCTQLSEFTTQVRAVQFCTYCIGPGLGLEQIV